MMASPDFSAKNPRPAFTVRSPQGAGIFAENS